MLVKTTVIGSWPKPAYLNSKDWFIKLPQDYNPVEGNNGGNDTLLEKAIEETIAKQISIGLDVITDGEMDRRDYCSHFCHKLRAVDVNIKRMKTMRNGATGFETPTITSSLASGCRETGWCAKEFSRSNAIFESVLGRTRSDVDRRVGLKYTLPGPMTILDQLNDGFYGGDKEGRRKAAKDLVKVLNKEILLLADAGCKFIQLDEPVIMRYPEEAAKFGINNVKECFKDLPVNVTSIVHLCCGYPEYLDQEGYQKANKEWYSRLAEQLDETGVAQVSIENAEADNDLPRLLPRFRRAAVILGAVKVARSSVETPAEVAEVAERALALVGGDEKRLWLAPDCGLGFLPEETAEEKLRSMIKAAKEI